MNHACPHSTIDSGPHKRAELQHADTFINMNVHKHVMAAMGHVSGPVRQSRHGQAGLLFISSSICLHNQAQGLAWPLSQGCISPLVDTLISPFCATLWVSLSARQPVGTAQLCVHLQPTMTRQINKHANMLRVTFTDLAFNLARVLFL